MNQKPPNAISNFNIELTRKCNMKCDFCHRGKAQNLEITPYIIDKTFEELKDTLLLSIQFSGGEPTLAPKMFDYAVDSIIRNKIKIANAGIFTNGILLNPDFLNSMKKLFSYIISNPVDSTLLNRFSSKYSAKKMYVIISDVEHKNGDKLQYAIDFYNQIVDDEYEVVLQSEKLSEDSIIEIEGRAFENYEKILPNPVPIKTYRIPVNNYHIISHSEDTGIDIAEGGIVNVSANGNVFIDAEPYECVDAHPMFNIIDCNNDFWMKLENWCWKYPYGVSAKNAMEVYNTIKFCEQKGLSVSVSEDYETIKKAYETLMVYIDYLKESILKIHNSYPLFKFSECEKLAAWNLYSILTRNCGMAIESTLYCLSEVTDCKYSEMKEFSNPFYEMSYLLKLNSKYRYK